MMAYLRPKELVVVHVMVVVAPVCCAVVDGRPGAGAGVALLDANNPKEDTPALLEAAGTLK